LSSVALGSLGMSVRMSPTDPAMVFVGGENGLLLKWNRANNTSTPLGEPRDRHQSHVMGLCISEDGTAVASGSADQTVRLWDTATGALRWTSEKQNKSVCSVAMHGDMVLCAVDNSQTVGLRMRDGKAAATGTFAKAGKHASGLVVTRGEHWRRMGGKERWESEERE
jgi:WD40 repeat protein